ncbi:MAG: radical SAM protein [Clostridia bacterium]|nr:radical SAM protein [Clostridia bacterium]MDD4542377.1 radical SAM protein [Clostridia bacterium]
MIFTRHFALVKSEGKKFILINTLNGKIVEISAVDKDHILSWIKKGSVDKRGKLNEFLMLHGFMYTNVEEENKERKLLVDKLVCNDNSHKKNIDNIAFILTYNCNFACPYCYEKGINNETSTLTQQMVDAALEMHMHSLKSIHFFGGEPFLPQNTEIVKYILSKTPNLKYSAMTNGYYLEEYLDILKSVDIDFIQVTLDGAEKSHNKTRILKSGKGTYKKIMRGVDKALKSEVPIKIRMNVDENNIVECQELRESLISKYILFKDILSFELYPIFQVKSKITLMEKIIEHDMQASSNNDILDYNHILQSGLPIENYFAVGSVLKPIIHFCNAHGTQRFFDPLGNIYSCILSVGNEKAAIGEYYPNYVMYEDSIATRNITKIRECNECGLALICGGGCPLSFINKNENIMQPNCQGIKIALRDKIPCFIKSKKQIEGEELL